MQIDFHAEKERAWADTQNAIRRARFNAGL